MLARFFAPSGISKRYFRLDLAPMVPGLSPAPNQRLTNFCTLTARARTRPPKFRASNPGEGNFDDRISERSTYAVPQSVGMFAIKGSTTTFVKHDSVPGGAMIGADVIPSLSNQENTRCGFPNMRTSVITISLAQIYASIAGIA